MDGMIQMRLLYVDILVLDIQVQQYIFREIMYTTENPTAYIALGTNQIYLTVLMIVQT